MQKIVLFWRINYYDFTRVSKKLSRTNFSKPKSIGLFHRQNHGWFANDLPHNPLRLVYSTESFQYNVVISRGRGRASDSCFIADTCATFLELLYPSIHTSLRQNTFSIIVHKVFNKLCTKSSINWHPQAHSQPTKNISLHAALLSCKSHMWSSHFFLAPQLQMN